ncbi:hypothetical protein ISS03_03510 [Patescibacteria group bacterium]|nr:hypothetical protein [Patescibacteria group bacterium]
MLEKIINSSIRYLAATQTRNGSFPSYTSINEEKFDNAYLCESVFSTALILSSLSKLEETPDLKIIKRKAAYFLINQKSNHWTFNYWDRRSADYLKMPYPDDLDDTSCALAALFEYNPKLIDGDVLANFVTLLTILEIKEGGPYKSWITDNVTEKVWQDVDLAVNSNIAYFLSLHEVNLAGLDDLIEKAIINENYTSPYYTSPYPILYFISRSYNGQYKEKIINYLLNKQLVKSNWGNPLFTALSFSVLENLGHLKNNDQKNNIKYLLDSHRNGVWPAHSFYLGINPVGDKNRYHAGSNALTTALCLEALAKDQKNQNSKKTIEQKDPSEAFVKSQVVENVKKVIRKLDKKSQKEIIPILERNLVTDITQPIVLLPYLFTKMLGETGNQITNNQLIELGEINLQGWLAYFVYDNIIDNDGDEKSLPIANILSRQVYKKINNFSQNYPDFKNYFETILNKIDISNSWEINNCRIIIKDNKINTSAFVWPNFDDLTALADKSMGHAIGPIAILMLLGYCTESKEVKNLMLFFKHYIVARQLNDDAHDWESDLKNGQLTFVTKNVLNKFTKEKVDLKKDLLNLQKIFWYESIVEVCKEAIIHAQKAQEYLAKIEIIKDQSLFNQFLASVRKASQKALDERKQTLEFLETYKKIEQSKN